MSGFESPHEAEETEDEFDELDVSDAEGGDGVGVGVGGAELTTEIAKILKERKINTVYLTNLKDATQGNICEGVE